MNAIIFLITTAACCLMMGPARADTPAPAITWPEKLYNPTPAAGDLILPLACGGAMVFRPVEIPGGNLLDDRQVELGQTDAARGYKEGRRLSHLAGAFSMGTAAARRYYIAKYETTRDQYAALTADTCPQPTMRGRLPMTDVSWFDAVDFTRRTTEWLLTKAPAALPREEQEPGFLRLPTEEEWEFATRGGLAVDDTDFLATVFPMPDGDLARYAWHESTGSAAGELHPVGLLKPNPLGLYDVLGNAAEMTLAPFHLDRRGRPHGQPGGFVSRGGDVFTPASQIGSAVRQEHNYFNATTGRAKALDSLGFRLVVTAPVIVSAARLDAIKESWSELPSLTGDVRVDSDKALAELQEVARQSQDDALRTRLELIQRNVEQAHAGLNEARARTVRALLRMGAFMGKRVVTDGKRAEVLQGLMGLAQSNFDTFAKQAQGSRDGPKLIAEARDALAEKMTKWQGMLAEIEQGMASSLSYYGDMVVNVGRDYGAAEVGAELKVVDEELKTKDNAYLIPYADLFARHLDAYRQAGAADKATWQQDLLQIEPTVSPGTPAGGSAGQQP
ncbi:MAG: SUMF1/EgtB/PvdO family nonheme iron enzyme [Lamprocystis purpurea]|jgi:formylglycine-generating enzyme required for sulfatase activity|uniref:formylglycine-generating enzyme family protein n=1 Tax=Lamprocystis purpurea TaxID=61598 RepID=UPI00036059A3|nr:SUMF1/EgtB/PvdO family nonheme iron enzyme [Lamprocystis purpurea]MBV5273976.1 SUMF1/EgtB/PvdO family nonheme iron enzyme [Lamprocystis purpurea]